jgi:hypothetical protein
MKRPTKSPPRPAATSHQAVRLQKANFARELAIKVFVEWRAVGMRVLDERYRDYKNFLERSQMAPRFFEEFPIEELRLAVLDELLFSGMDFEVAEAKISQITESDLDAILGKIKSPGNCKIPERPQMLSVWLWILFRFYTESEKKRIPQGIMEKVDLEAMRLFSAANEKITDLMRAGRDDIRTHMPNQNKRENAVDEKEVLRIFKTLPIGLRPYTAAGMIKREAWPDKTYPTSRAIVNVLKKNRTT